MVAGAASQFFCGPGNAGGVADGDALSAVTDSTDECVFRDDTLVLLEMTTRDMMEVGSGLGSGGPSPPRPAPEDCAGAAPRTMGASRGARAAELVAARGVRARAASRSGRALRWRPRAP